jgi:hypothetical protein
VRRPRADLSGTTRTTPPQTKNRCGDEHESGEIRIDGRSVATLSDDDLTRLRRDKITIRMPIPSGEPPDTPVIRILRWLGAGKFPSALIS